MQTILRRINTHYGHLRHLREESFDLSTNENNKMFFENVANSSYLINYINIKLRVVKRFYEDCDDIICNS